MKKSMKKILSLVLVVMMCVSVAVPAFATETAATCPGIDEDHFKTNCTYTKIDTYEPKCTERGYTVYQCNTCSKYFADDFVLNTEEHDYDVTKEATCTEKGEKVCSKCGDKQEIDALGHNWTPDNNTCMAPDELVHQTCTRCDAERDVAATGIHTWKIEVVEKPTCGKDGKAVYTCTVCEYSKDVAIDYHTAEAGDHKWVFVEAKEMVCKEGEEAEGNTAGYVCSVCGTAAEVGATITVVENNTEKTVTIVDGENFYEVIEIAHAPGSTTTIPATCTTPVCYVTVCVKCQKMDMVASEEDDEQALGHLWTWEEESGWETTACKIENGVFVPGKSVVEGTCGRAGCGISGSQTRYHEDVEDIDESEEGTSVEIEVIENKATCVTGAYTEYTCDLCGHFETAKGEVDTTEDGHNYKYIYPGSPDIEGEEDEYEDLFSAATYAPTCTTAGRGFKACMNGCGFNMELVDVPATGHSYMKAGENGALVYDTTKAEYNCATGKYEYTCTNVGCLVEKNANGNTEEIDIPGFDKNDIKFHKSWDSETNTWTGGKDITLDNGCGKDAIWTYTCACGTSILVIVENGHTEGIGAAYKAPTCTTVGNYKYFTCTACQKFCYYDAEGELVEVGTQTEIAEMINEWLAEVNAGKAEGDEGWKTSADYARPWMLPATGCNVVIDKVFVAPTCGKPGQSAAWHCTNANCDVTAPTYDESFETYILGGVTYVKVMDKSAETAAKLTGTMVSVELTTEHYFEVATVKHGAPLAVDRTCSDYGYIRNDCKFCDTWMWTYYKDATDHNIYHMDAACTEDGYDICINTWCEYRDAETNALVKDVEKNPTYKVIKSTGHKDAEGNPIICVAEDFWCDVCRPEPVEDSKRFYPDDYAKLPWYESHNTAGEDWRAIQAKYATTYGAKGGMIPTDLSSVKDCTVWRYLLWVCPDCEDDSKGGYFNDETAPCTEHVYTDVDANPDVVYAPSKNNLDKIPAAAYTMTIKTATFAEAGIKGVPCDCVGCEQPVATKEYVRDDIGFDISIDSGIVAGADLVNSGKMKVTVLVNAWQVSLYSLDFELAYSTEYFTFEGFELPEGSPFGKSGVYAAAKDGEVEVYMANAGETLTNLNLELKGTQKAVVVLVFDIKDAVNASNLGTTSGTLTLNDAHVLTAAGTAVTVAVDPDDLAANIANPDYVASKADDITKYSDNDAAYIIKALGNVTSGVIENEEYRVDDLDALNWQALFINKKYLAAADINKNGKLDAQDYEYLCTYIVDGMTYADLCAK